MINVFNLLLQCIPIGQANNKSSDYTSISNINDTEYYSSITKSLCCRVTLLGFSIISLYTQEYIITIIYTKIIMINEKRCRRK